jgi:uncharacterized protein (UPF0332 family)
METKGYKKDLSKYRLEKAKENIEAAEILLERGLYAESINRSYYAIFHSVRGLLAFDEFDSKKHSGIISFFNLNYIKSNKIEKEYSTILTGAFTIRNKSDYDDFFIALRKDAEEQVENSKKFYERIINFLNL